MSRTQIIVLVIIVLLVILFFYFNGKKEKNLAKCISHSGAKFYGTPTCSHCNNQKAKFGVDAKYLPFIDCSKNRDKCMGITGYPTWVINGEKYMGELELSRLASLTGCKI